MQAAGPAGAGPAGGRSDPAADAGYAAAHAGDYAVVPLKADLSRFDEPPGA